MYFHRAELSDLTGVQSTSILIQIPDGTSLEGLSDVTIGYSLKEDAIKTLKHFLSNSNNSFSRYNSLELLLQ